MVSVAQRSGTEITEFSGFFDTPPRQVLFWIGA
jgi:hypothetical protein